MENADVNKREELYKGKAKTVFATDDPNLLVMHYRDDVSAFDGAKLAKLESGSTSRTCTPRPASGSTQRIAVKVPQVIHTGKP